MGESELIEIANRFIQLERSCAEVSKVVAPQIRMHEEKLNQAEKLLESGKGYDETRGIIARHDREIRRLTEVRDSLEKRLDICRRDMDAMQEAIRRAQRD